MGQVAWGRIVPLSPLPDDIRGWTHPLGWAEFLKAHFALQGHDADEQWFGVMADNRSESTHQRWTQEIINSAVNAECQKSGFPSGSVLITVWPQENPMAPQSLSFPTCYTLIRFFAAFHYWWRTDYAMFGPHELRNTQTSKQKTLSRKISCWLFSLRPNGAKHSYMIYEYKMCLFVEVVLFSF